MSNYTKWQENERAESRVERAEFCVERAEISGIAFLRIPAISCDMILRTSFLGLRSIHSGIVS